MGVSTIFYEYILFSLFFYSTKEIQIGKVEMRAKDQESALFHLSHAISEPYDSPSRFQVILLA